MFKLQLMSEAQTLTKQKKPYIIAMQVEFGLVNSRDFNVRRLY